MGFFYKNIINCNVLNEVIYRRHLGVEEKLAPIRFREDVVVLEPDDGRQTQHFRAQHEHAEHWHQREHAHDFAVGF